MVVKAANSSLTTFASNGVRASESSTTRRSIGCWMLDVGCWIFPGRRIVSDGSSINTVFTPTRIASAPWRSFIPCARACGPVIHLDSPPAVAILPSRVMRRLDGDPRRAVNNPVIEGFVETSAFRGQKPAAAPIAVRNLPGLNPGATENGERAARVARVRIGRPHNHPANGRGDDGVGAGRGASVRGAGFQGHIKSGAPRRVPACLRRRAAPRSPRAATPPADASRAR